ncbi:MAG: FkbM family methyltransferase [Sulfuricurvum sp.]|nr:FkbM family methyltransferase [Sulfuricurvum sp.]
MEKIAIYGAGQYGQIFYAALSNTGVEIDFFIDTDPSKTELYSKPVYRIEKIPLETTIYISVLNLSDRIKEELTLLGYQNICTFIETLKQFPTIMNEVSKRNFLWMRSNPLDMIDTDKIHQFRELLSDNKSLHTLDQITAFRNTYDMNYYPYPDGEKEYFPSDVPILDNLTSVRFIDCGAYIGDTVADLMKTNKSIESVVSFEPDKQNFQKLLSETKKHQGQFITLNAGVWSTNTLVNFSNDNSSFSKIGEDGSFIPVMALDQTVFSARPNYIKMDIEGAEQEALKGSREIIQTYSPHLAICLYHRPQDFWEIPLMIHEMNPHYSMYLRVHEHMGLSTVLYCIPKSGVLND